MNRSHRRNVSTRKPCSNARISSIKSDAWKRTQTSLLLFLWLAGLQGLPGLQVQKSYQTAQQWIASGQVPARFCAALEATSGVSRFLLRPSDASQIWPELAEKEPDPRAKETNGYTNSQCRRVVRPPRHPFCCLSTVEPGWCATCAPSARVAAIGIARISHTGRAQRLDQIDSLAHPKPS